MNIKYNVNERCLVTIHFLKKFAVKILLLLSKSMISYSYKPLIFVRHSIKINYWLMIAALAKGFALGLLLSISVGPVIFSVIKQSLNNGHKGGFAFIARCICK